MEYIATAALVVIAIELVLFQQAFRVFMGRLVNFVTANPTQDVQVILCQEDRDLLTNYRRYAPRAKKETV